MVTVKSLRMRLILSAVLLAVALSACAGAQSETPRKNMLVNVSGNCTDMPLVFTVFDRSDTLLAGVDIVAYIGEELMASVTTNREGVASFVPKEAGTYSFVLTRARFKPFELEHKIEGCGSCNDSIRNRDEEGVDCGGSCPACTTTTTTEPTTTTTTEPTTTSTTRRTTTTTTTTTEPTTTTTSSTTTTTEAQGFIGVDTGLLLVGVFLVLVAAAYFVYFRFTKGGGGGGGGEEDTSHKSSELYKKSAEAEKQKSSGYAGFQKKPAEEDFKDRDAEKLNAELKALRSDWKGQQQPPAPAPKKPEAPKELKIPTLRSANIMPPKVFSTNQPPAGKKAMEEKLDKDFKEIERLEDELRSLKKNLKEK